MTFLWTFGLVVEGAVGFGPFLAIYGIAAVIPGALFQILVQSEESIGACGASAAVSGLMAIAALWAPKNRIRLFIWILVIVRRIEVSVLGFCMLWLGLDLYLALRGGFSGFAHVTGAVVGVGIGVVMLRKKWLDCEGWD